MIGFAAILEPFRYDATLENGLRHLLNGGFCPFDTMPCDRLTHELTFCLNAHGRLIKIDVPLPCEKVDDFL